MSKRNEKETVGSIIAFIVISMFFWSTIGTVVLWVVTNPKIFYAGQSNYSAAIAADAVVIGK